MFTTNDTFDIDGYCPRFDCAGGDDSTGACLGDDTAATLTQVQIMHYTKEYTILKDT